MTKLLIVEDVPSSRNVLKEILKPLSNNIAEAENGLLAFQRIQEEEFDAVLKDIGKNGKNNPIIYLNYFDKIQL